MIGIHHWYSRRIKYDYNAITNAVDRFRLETHCLCGHTKKFEPGTRKWKKGREDLQREYNCDPNMIIVRGGILLEDGFEIDLATGIPVSGSIFQFKS
jgi:hypothetical protein